MNILTINYLQLSIYINNGVSMYLILFIVSLSISPLFYNSKNIGMN